MADEADDVEFLRGYAAELGVKVDQRWGADRLKKEIETAEGVASPPEARSEIDELKAMVATLVEKNADMERRLGEQSQRPMDAQHETELTREGLLKQARSLEIPVSDKWSATRLQQAVEEAIADVEDAAEARQAAYERTTEFVTGVVTQFGGGKVSIGRHVGGSGDMRASKGKSLRLDMRTAKDLEVRGFIEITGPWKDE